MKVVGYIRVSTETQAKHNDSLAGQKARIEDWCKSNGHTLIGIYAEPGSSAYADKRPVYRQMMNDLLDRKVTAEGIVVYSFSRFSRNLKQKLIDEEKLASVGISLHSCSESVPDDLCSGFIIGNIYSTMDQAQSMRNSQVVSDRMQQTAQKGYFTGSHAPFGYETIVAPGTENSTRKKILVINTEEANLVKKIFQYAYKGESGIGYGLKRISSKLNEQGFLRRGKLWTTGSVHKILKNPAYFGERIYGTKRKRKDLKHDPVIVPCPPIIDKDLYDSVNRQMNLRAPDKSESRAQISPSILTGLLKCSICGCNMVLVTGKSGKYTYYKCRNQVKSTVRICACPKFRQSLIENAVVKAIEENLLTTERLKYLAKQLSAEIMNSFSDDRRRLLALQRKEKAVISKMSLLYEKVSEGKLDLDETLTHHLHNLKQQRSTLISEIIDIQQKIKMPIKKFGTKQIEAFTQASKKILLEMDSSATKAYLRAFVSSIEVSSKEVVIRGGKFLIAAGISQYQSGHSDDVVPRLISNWRRGRDSNPRNAINVYTLSRRAPSATRPPLQ